MSTLFENELIGSGATIVGNFRYELWRAWGKSSSMHADPTACFVMLNPSTAGVMDNDPTIRRCIGFAKSFHCVAIRVVNLYAYRATDPRELKRAGYPVGDGNDDVIRRTAAECSLVIAAWGAHAPHDRAAAVAELLIRQNYVNCLGRCACGCPKHPLMLAGDTKLTPFGERDIARLARV